MKTTLNWIPVLCLMVLAGCGLEGPVPTAPKREAAAPASQPSAQKPAVPETATGKSTAEPKPGTVREKAAIGMGEKGRGYGGGMITMPVKAMWTAREKIVLDQMQHALDLYKATEGHSPKTQEEFMERIIKENHLQLPTLPPRHRYVYDPDTAQLLVERPDDL